MPKKKISFKDDLEILELWRYNGINQLIWAYIDGVAAEYSYRPDNLRHSKTVDGVVTTHLWDGQNIAADVTGSSVPARYLRGVGLIAREQDGAMQYYRFNAHGDVVQRCDAWGNPLKSYEYDAFGVEENPEKLDTNPFRYCGEYYDRETKTVYLRARYYNPATSRMLSEDTIRFVENKLPNGQKVIDPLSLNPYTYCHNNPIMFVDPSGKKRVTYDLGKGWYADTDTADTNTKTQRHVHLHKGNKNWAQNEDGSPHDKNNNSNGSPPDKVLKQLKEKTGWDWSVKIEQFEDQVDIKTVLVSNSIVPYALLIYPDGYQAMVMDPSGIY